MSAQRKCEVCGATSAEGFELAAESSWLCAEHTTLIRSGKLSSLEQLRQTFAQDSERRSLLDRRALEERRQFPPRPEGRRHATNRRSEPDSR